MENTRIIAVVSGKGGVGKTTVTVNLGRAIAKLGKKTLLIDADFSLNNIDVVSCMENSSPYDLSDVMTGRARLKQAIVKDKYEQNLDMIFSNGLKPDCDYTPQAIKAVLYSYERFYDYVFIDSPAGIDVGFMRAAALSEEAFVVTCLTQSGLRDADKTIDMLENSSVPCSGIILNRVRGDLIASGRTLTVKEAETLLKKEVAGVIPEDDAILLSDGELKGKRAAKAFKLLAKKVINGENSSVYDPVKEYRGFFGKIKRSFRAR